MPALATNLARKVKSFKYVRNHHYIELEDENGNVIRLVERSMLQGRCKRCSMETMIDSTAVRFLNCFSCGGEIDWIWGKAQICFVPEAESDFKPPERD